MHFQVFSASDQVTCSLLLGFGFMRKEARAQNIVERGETRRGVKRATLAFTGMRNYNETKVITA